MAFYSNFTNLNMDLFSGLNNFFAPQSSFTPPSWFTTNIFSNFNLPSFNFQMPLFNLNYSWNCMQNNSIWNNYSSTTPAFNSVFTPQFVSTIDFSTPTFSSMPASDLYVRSANKTSKTYTGSLKDYNPALGKKLAEKALYNANYYVDSNTKTLTSRRKSQDKFTGLCATYVKMAIRDAGAGSYVSGHAYQMTDILKNNPNFKQISPNSVDVKDLPEGCILVYAKGAEGYSSEYGHTEITTKNKKGVSDGVTNNLRKPTAIFIPV